MASEDSKNLKRKSREILNLILQDFLGYTNENNEEFWRTTGPRTNIPNRDLLAAKKYKVVQIWPGLICV